MPRHFIILFIYCQLTAQLFEDITDQSGTAVYRPQYSFFGAGATMADFDQDGYMDVFVATPNGDALKVFHNLGNETFEEVADLSLDEKATKLDVRYTVEGTLWKMDDVFQLSVELYDTKESKVVWSDRWQEEWENLYAIKGNISDGILKTLLASHQDENITKISHPEAYEYYLRAQYKWTNRKDKEDIEFLINFKTLIL